MSYIEIKSKYHCALNGQGLILQGSPDRLISAYEQAQAAVYGQRFASGDRSYNDLSQWWYFVQTDWSGGLKDVLSWADDAKYYYSTNIDAFSEPGTIKLLSNIALEKDFTEEIVCATYTSPSNTAYGYVGTNNSGGSTKPAIFRQTAATTWGNISSAFMPTTQQSVMDIMTHKTKLWFITMDKTSGGTYEVGYCSESGGTPTDLSANLTIAPRHVYCMDSDGATMYVGYRGTAGNQGAIIAKSIDNGATWTTIVNLSNDGCRIPCIKVVGSDVYYFVTSPSGVELRKYDGSVDVSIWIFTGASLGNASYATICQNDQSAVRGASISRKGIVILGGKLILTLYKEIWSFDLASGDMNRIFKADENKRLIDQASLGETYEGNFLCMGGIVHDNKIWWGNLVFDGDKFFNGKTEITDTPTSYYLQPVFSNGTSMYWHDNNDFTKLYVDSGYKGTADKNYIVLNNFDLISGVDKIAYSATVLFKPLIAGQSIVVEYFLGELASGSVWTALGTASYTLDGGTVREKTFLFGSAVIYKKIWFRIKLNGGGSDTPAMNDIVMEYLPMPTFKKTWSLNINCGDSVKKLSGGLVDKTGASLKNSLEVAWWTKSILDFQDMDYATTLLNGSLSSSATSLTVDSTVDFPDQGRLHIDDEEILYSGKTPTTFTGLTRGARSTRAASHSDNAVVNNAFRVLITNLTAKVPIALQGDKLEYIVSVALKEV